jgi:hypothetical protein
MMTTDTWLYQGLRQWFCWIWTQLDLASHFGALQGPYAQMMSWLRYLWMFLPQKRLELF